MNAMTTCGTAMMPGPGATAACAAMIGAGGLTIGTWLVLLALGAVAIAWLARTLTAKPEPASSRS